MPKELKTYTLKVGEKAQERLCILNSACNPFTLSLLDRLSSLKNKTVLDVGCGIGIMTYEFSKRVGRVTGIDVSQEQLKIAEKFIRQKKRTNINFKLLSVSQLNQLKKKYDLIYCRMLLCHMPNPKAILKQMLNRLKPKGILILEEPTGYEPMFSYPASKVFEQCKQIHLLQGKAFNTDFQIGRKLYHWLQSYNMNIIHDQLIQPLLKTEYEKRQLWLAIEEMSETLIKKRLVTEDQIKQTIKKLQKYAANDKYHAAFVQYRQIAVSTTTSVKQLY